MSPLSVHPDNPRYFRDDAGRAVYLTGSHHWDSVIDNDERPGGLDYVAFLDRLAAWGHNFTRLWALEAWLHDVRPRPWLRTGPGRALDGGPRFDLTRFDPEYFERLRSRVRLASERGLFVSVMLFNGWAIENKGAGNPWDRHPFNRRNNANGVDGDPDATADGAELHTLRLPEVTRLQEEYVARVVEAVGDGDHVLWEIANESHGRSLAWQAHLVRMLRTVESHAGRAHPIGITFPYPGGRNADLLGSPADWVSLGPRGGYRTAPPAADGRKVSLLDTDHLFGIGGGADWVWKSFLRGHHPSYMDPLDDDPEHAAARRAMGDTLRYARRLDLAACVPDVRLCSSGYALADRTPGRERLLAYLPRGRGRFALGPIAGELRGEWLDVATGATHAAAAVPGGGVRRLRAPFHGAAVVLLHRP